jgi:hypothetical protein
VEALTQQLQCFEKKALISSSFAMQKLIENTMKSEN